MVVWTGISGLDLWRVQSTLPLLSTLRIGLQSGPQRDQRGSDFSLCPSDRIPTHFMLFNLGIDPEWSATLTLGLLPVCPSHDLNKESRPRRSGGLSSILIRHKFQILVLLPGHASGTRTATCLPPSAPLTLKLPTGPGACHVPSTCNVPPAVPDPLTAKSATRAPL